MQLMICDSDKHLPKCFPSEELYRCSGNSPPLCIQSKKPIIVFFLQISEFCLEVGHNIIEKQNLHHSSLQTPKSREFLYIFCTMLYLGISCHGKLRKATRHPGAAASKLSALATAVLDSFMATRTARLSNAGTNSTCPNFQLRPAVSSQSTVVQLKGTKKESPSANIFQLSIPS